MNRTLHISLVALCSLLAGCIPPEGWTRSVWNKQDLVAWYNDHEPTNSNLTKFGYAGSDDLFHYFITRPVDSFFAPKISKSELTMLDERPKSNLGNRLYFYLVDPRRDFHKILDASPSQTSRQSERDARSKRRSRLS